MMASSASTVSLSMKPLQADKLVVSLGVEREEDASALFKFSSVLGNLDGESR